MVLTEVDGEMEAPCSILIRLPGSQPKTIKIDLNLDRPIYDVKVLVSIMHKLPGFDNQ